jgi:hypothetical protein
VDQLEAFMSEERPEKVVEEAIRAMERRQRMFATAFSRNSAIHDAAALLATPRWMKTIEMLPNQLVGANSALRAIEGLAEHQSAWAMRVPEHFRTAPLFNVAENLRKTLFTYHGVIENLHETLTAPLRINRAVFDQLAVAARRFAEQQRETDAHLDAFVLRHGWPVPLSLPMSAYQHVVSLAARPKREVTSSMVHWFRPQSKVFRECAGILVEHELLASRRPLIRQALRAHRRGDFYLVINALMPLVEGVLVDAIYADGSPPERRGTAKAIEKLKSDTAGKYLEGTVAAVERLVVSGAAGMGLFSTVKRATWGADGEPRSLNRHAILHGFARRYATEANALKMILLLGVIVQVTDTND